MGWEVWFERVERGEGGREEQTKSEGARETRVALAAGDLLATLAGREDRRDGVLAAPPHVRRVAAGPGVFAVGVVAKRPEVVDTSQHLLKLQFKFGQEAGVPVVSADFIGEAVVLDRRRDRPLAAVGSLEPEVLVIRGKLVTVLRVTAR